VRAVPIDAATWTTLLEQRGGLSQVIGATVEVVGSGAAAIVRFGDDR